MSFLAAERAIVFSVVDLVCSFDDPEVVDPPIFFVEAELGADVGLGAVEKPEDARGGASEEGSGKGEGGRDGASEEGEGPPLIGVFGFVLVDFICNEDLKEVGHLLADVVGYGPAVVAGSELKEWSAAVVSGNGIVVGVGVVV